MLGAQLCVGYSAAHNTNSLRTYVSVLVLCACQNPQMLPELTLQGIVRRNEIQRPEDFDSVELELMLWWYCMVMHSQCCSTHIRAVEWTMPDALCTSGSMNGRAWLDRCMSEPLTKRTLLRLTTLLTWYYHHSHKACQHQASPICVGASLNLRPET